MYIVGPEFKNMIEIESNINGLETKPYEQANR